MQNYTFKLNKKRLILLIFLSITAFITTTLAILSFYYSYRHDNYGNQNLINNSNSYSDNNIANTTNSPTQEPKNPKDKTDYLAEIDFSGDGKKEHIKIDYIPNSHFAKLNLYESSDNLITPFPDNITFDTHDFFETLKLDDNDSKEYLAWHHNIGPHEIETYFFGFKNGKIFIVPIQDSDETPQIKPLYTSRRELVTMNIDDNSEAEIFEFADEYPPNAPKLSYERANAEVSTYIKEDNQIKNDLIKILMRDNIGEGRGKKVIWNVYRFVNSLEKPYIKRLNGKEYTKVAEKYKKFANETAEKIYNDEPYIITRDEITQDSINFNKFVRNFWKSHPNLWLKVREENEKLPFNVDPNAPSG